MNTRKVVTKPEDLKEPMGSITNHLTQVRQTQGFSQTQLARHVGITRQAVYAIETNQYLPSTAIALRIARVLNCHVEDLFSFQEEEEIIDAESIGPWTSSKEPVRVKLLKVGTRILARPMAELGDVLNFVMPADGVVQDKTFSGKKKGSCRVTVKLLQPREVVERGIMIAGCDPALFLAGEHVRKINAVAGVSNWTMGSANALNALQRGEVHMAGLHLVDKKSGKSNIPYLKRRVRSRDYRGVRFASWTQGLLLQSGNPKLIRGIQDLGRSDVRLVNRETGAGARFFLDELLNEKQINSKTVTGYRDVVGSHLEVARHIRDRLADVGVGVETVARYFDLDFIPLREEQYDLIMRADFLDLHPMAEAFLDAVVSQSFRREIEALGGYNLRDVGKILEW